MLSSNLHRLGGLARARVSVPASKSTTNTCIWSRTASRDSGSNKKAPTEAEKQKLAEAEKERQKRKEDAWHGKKKLIDRVDLGFKKKGDVRAAAEDPKNADAEAGKEVPIPSNLLKAVKSVVEDLGGDTEKIESELVQKLKDQVNATKVKLSDVFAGMKIEQSQKPKHAPDTGSMMPSRAQRVRKVFEDQNRYQQQRGPPFGGDSGRDRRDRQPFRRDRDSYQEESRVRRKVDLFGAPPLGIFKRKPAEEYVPASQLPKLATWDALEAKEMKLAVTHPPRNGFEEMILWTEQGKLWKFPINNEDGLEEEAKSSFHEHVFLEPLIEPWCPQKGPLRNFMELVCVGLGKNHYMTVKEKHEYLEWYHNFFKEHSAVVKETGLGVVK